MSSVPRPSFEASISNVRFSLKRDTESEVAVVVDIGSTFGCVVFPILYRLVNRGKLQKSNNTLKAISLKA